MDYSTPGFPILYYLLEFAQTYAHWVDDAIQPSHPLLPTSPPTLNLSQHQGLFQWVGSSHQMPKVLSLQLQHQSFQWIFRLISFKIDWFDLLAVQGPLENHLQHQFESINSSGLSLLYGPTLTAIWLLEKTIALTRRTFVTQWKSPSKDAQHGAVYNSRKMKHLITYYVVD